MRFEFMTMEEIFIVTWIGAILAGVLLGLLFAWIENKFNKEDDRER